jgi:hypothetical protein
MPTINWKHCVGQQRVKETLEAAIVNNSLGHAYLFSGDAGSGKFATALDLALILLCEDKGSRPCMTCASCTKVLHYAHPDFHVVMPIDLPKELKGGDDNDGDDADESPKKEDKKWAYIFDRVKERINDAYLLPEHSKKPDIPVSWIRELNHAILRGSLGTKVNVSIFDGVDLMKPATANSMLKTLEEPPAGTILILLTDRISAVLPTIVSRCQLLRFAWLSPEELRAELVRRFSVTPDDARLDNVAAAGSLGKAIYLWNNTSDQEQAAAAEFWELCTQGKWPELARCIDELSGWDDVARYVQFFGAIMERVRNAFLRELPGAEKLFSGRNMPGAESAGPVPLGRSAAILDVCERSIAAVRSHGSITLVLANAALAVTEALNGEKQQSR